MKKFGLLGSTAAILALQAGLSQLPTQAAHAQDEAASEDETVTLDRVTVTSRKQEENILDVPIAVTAFDAQKIESLGLFDIRDLPAVTPGFTYESFATVPGRFDNSPRFRGVGVNTGSPTRQTASVFVDGIFVAGGVQGIALNNVERVEIIKGPQSAFFGRNTFGGAVNYITKTPGEEMAGRVSGSVATRDDFRLDGSFETPLIKDVLSGRVNGSWRDKGGHYNNSVDGSELGAEETWSLSGSLFFTPSENFDGKFNITYFENEDGAPASTLAGLNDHNCGPFPAPGTTATDTTICGIVPINAPGQNLTQPQSFFDAINGTIPLNGQPRSEYGLDRQSLRISGQFDYTLGNGIVFSSLTGYNDEEVNLLLDADYTGDNAFASFASRQFEDFSQEFRLAGDALSDRLDWSAGVNYFEQRFTNNGEFVAPPLGNFLFGGGEPAEENIETLGVFGSLGFAVTDQVDVTLEGRFQRDKVEEDDDTTDGTPGLSEEFENFLPRVIVDYQATPSTLLYASFSKGNLPGGFNEEVLALDAAGLSELLSIEPGAQGAFDEEELDNYEIGWKQSFDNGSFFSVAAFMMERTNQTVRRSDFLFEGTPQQDQVNYFINIGESEYKGFEFEGTFVAADGVSLDGTLAYIKGEIKNFNTGVFGEVFGTTDASGQTTDRFPEWSGSISLNLDGQVSENWDWFASGNLFYTGERFADELNLAVAQDGTQLNLSGGIQNDRYRIELFGRNITDDDSPVAINRFRDLSFATPLFDFGTFGYQVGLRDRNQWGIRASANF